VKSKRKLRGLGLGAAEVLQVKNPIQRSDSSEWLERADIGQ
jgi:hypothetical protein